MPHVVGLRNDQLDEQLVETVLARMGFSRRPEPTLEGLSAIYGRWCQHVPFDNVRKLIHVRSARPSPLPGSTAEDFFLAWLGHGTGGTCWSGANACHALLNSLGFAVERAVGTMLAAPSLPPNHGSVRVTLGGSDYLVDCSILHGEPLELVAGQATSVNHGAWGVRCEPREGRWHVRWRPLHKPEGFDCRLEYFGAGEREFRDRYEQTRGWSPFNYQLSVRINQGEEVVGAGFGQTVILRGNGSIERQPATREQLRRLLIETIGLSEEIVEQLPEDVPTPPPPGSLTAERSLSDARSALSVATLPRD